MGKKLIVKGADFSANGIRDSFLSSMPLVLGKAWAGTTGTKMSPSTASDNAARASQTAFVDISSVAAGFTQLKLKAKSGYKFAAYFGNTNVSGVANASIVNWGYTNSGDTLTVDISSCSYAVIMVASNDNSTLTSSDWDTYIEES